MITHSLKCCGIKEIDLLATHHTPEAAMLAFCQKELVLGASYFNGMHKPGKLNTFYLFTAAVYDAECKNWEKSISRRSDIEAGMWFPYGHRFAKFIEDHGMGTLITTEADINHAFHPDHKVQAWIWKPNREAIAVWYEKHKNYGELFRLRDALMSNIANAEDVKDNPLYYKDYMDMAADIRKKIAAEESRLNSLLTVVSDQELVCA